ncbi:MAG: class II glutamine amidotransferase [Candidatus Kapaibacterium sp.]
MCRFVAYSGPAIIADDLLYKPKYSLVTAQSINAGEMSVAVNGDGFGIGWYAPELDNEPCVFRSIKPAWSDANLRNLARKIHSPLMFMHIRAASPGMTVEEVNSHPFMCGRLMFMHNGMIQGFKDIRRQLLRTLKDTAYDAIQGSTDSEHMFGLFLNHIEDPYGEVSCDDMVVALSKALDDLSDLLIDADIRQHSYLNLCVSNGTSIVAVRYTTNQDVQPASMYYAFGSRYNADVEGCVIDATPMGQRHAAVLIASEPITARRSDWMKVERNCMMIVDESMRIGFRNIELPVERRLYDGSLAVSDGTRP